MEIIEDGLDYVIVHMTREEYDKFYPETLST
jgi:hypothetical protein